MDEPEARQHILVVDDDESVRESICALLEAYGYATASSPDGAEALRAMERRRPGLILTDLYMPRCDGFELIRAMRSVAPAIPIVAMSGSTPSETADYLAFASKLGAAAVVDKASLAVRIVEILESVLGGRPAPPFGRRT